MSPIQQNPYVEVGAGASPLRLAINTAQFGRTFQVGENIEKSKHERSYNLILAVLL